MRLFRALIVVVLLLGFAFYMFAYWPLRDKHPLPIMPTDAGLAITGARIYTSPDAPVIANGTIVTRNGKIVAVGENVPVPPGSKSSPAMGAR